MKQTFVRKPIEIVALRFRYNNREIEEFLKENNETCNMVYEWRFCVHDNEHLLEIREPLSQPNVYSIIEIPHGDYITTSECGTIIHMRQEDIEEEYNEVQEDDNKTRVTTFKGDFSTITNIVKELNSKCGHDRYECFCHEYPLYIEVCDCDRETQFNITKGDTLLIGKDGTLSKITKSGIYIDM